MKWKAYKYRWQADLLKPYDLLERWSCIGEVPFAIKSLYKRYLEKQKTIPKLRTVLSVVIFLFELILEPLQFIVYYSLLPFQIFSEWFCSLRNL